MEIKDCNSICATNHLNKIEGIKEEIINEDLLPDLLDESDPFMDENLGFKEFEGFPGVFKIKNGILYLDNLSKTQGIKRELIYDSLLCNIFDGSDPFKDEELEFNEFEGFPVVKRNKNEPIDLGTFDNNNEIRSSNIMKDEYLNFDAISSSDANEIPDPPCNSSLCASDKLLEMSSLSRSHENIEIKDEQLKFDTFNDSDQQNIEDSMRYDNLKEHSNKVKDEYLNTKMYQFLSKQNMQNEDVILDEKLFDSQKYACESIDMQENLDFTNNKKRIKVSVTSSKLNGKSKNYILQNSKEAEYKKLRNSKYPIVLVEKMNFKDKDILKTGHLVSLSHGNSLSFSTKIVMKSTRLQEETSSQKDIKCSKRDYTTRKKCNMNHHTLTHAGTKKAHLQCPYCHHKCNGKGAFSKHIATHREVKMFRCLHCDYSTNRKDNLNTHLLNHSDKKLKCPICLYETIYKRNLSRHLLIHSKSKLFCCSVCSFETNYKHVFEGHLIRHNDQTLLENYYSTGIKMTFKCDQCGYTTNAKRHLDAHAQKHRQQKLFNCSHCEYQTNERNNLKRHVLKHLGLKPNKCSECAYKTNDLGHLKRHTNLKHCK